MIIAIAGYNGLIGRRFMKDRKEEQWVRLSRDLLYGNVSRLSEALQGADLVLNLAGAPINTRWTRRQKKKIEESRHGVNTKIVEAINLLENKPRMFLTASAIGIYETGQTHDEKHHTLADNYLSEVVRMWEAPLENLAPEVGAVRLRIGIVLAREGGALKPLLAGSRFRILPVLGSGRQVYSFIHVEDLIEAIWFIIRKEKTGMYHLCAPHPVDNATLTRSLASVTGKSWIIRIPAFVFKLGWGEAHIMITEGPRVLPARLVEEGFEFRFPDIDTALSNLAKKR